MKWISSAEIFNIASAVSIYVAKKRVFDGDGFQVALSVQVGPEDGLQRAKLKFNKQLQPLCKSTTSAHSSLIE